MEIILTHNNADFDAAAGLLAAHKLYPQALPVLPARLNRNVAEFLTLYQNGLTFTRWEDFKPRKVKRLFVVDTQRVPSVRGLKSSIPTHIIDHHPIKDPLPQNYTIVCELVGAVTTLLVEQIQQRDIALNSLEATLLALGIYEDTGSLSYKTTTPRDIRAAAWLLEQHAVLDTVRRHLTPPLTDEQQMLFEYLLKNAQVRLIEGHNITIAGTRLEKNVSEISSVVHRMRDLLDTSALFVVVQTPTHINLVCRAIDEAVDVGEIARLFGGGGHNRAAAATIYGSALEDVIEQLWGCLVERVKPLTRVVDLMSYGLQTVTPDQPISAIIQQMRRVGHEGYPVVENGRIIGLLTRREADRAVEHDLGHLTVREIMRVGEITLSPDDSVARLEQRMVESGWGQIPVQNSAGKLIGIVTRTDLIKHWARTHPPQTPQPKLIEQTHITHVLGQSVTHLILQIAEFAQNKGINLYMVGGAVRDLLLYRHNLDLDFVTESDAIAFADALHAQFGGRVSNHRPFGTAKWTLDEKAAKALGVNFASLPDHIDFATSRNEFYEHPTALPTVYSGSIKLDLQRRDFTINTLAIQLSPTMGRILDFYGGLSDLERHLIRALHSLSFVDDPTRILRALRFAQRLGFTVEPRTNQLIEHALPMLRRITGERLRNELGLLLREPNPEVALLALQARAIPQAIHPAFTIQPDIGVYFDKFRTQYPQWEPFTPVDSEVLYWCAIICALPLDAASAVIDRLMFGKTLGEALRATARIINDDLLKNPAARPSQIALRLQKIPHLALRCAWTMSDDPLTKNYIYRYYTEWQHVQPVTNGDTLQQMGLKPGPYFKVILAQLRAARLDGKIKTDADEQQRLAQLVKEMPPDDRA